MSQLNFNAICAELSKAFAKLLANQSGAGLKVVFNPLATTNDLIRFTISEMVLSQSGTGHTVVAGTGALLLLQSSKQSQTVVINSRNGFEDETIAVRINLSSRWGATGGAGTGATGGSTDSFLIELKNSYTFTIMFKTTLTDDAPAIEAVTTPQLAENLEQP